jgi:hypothetical protein
MRIRKQDANGDFTFGQSSNNYYLNTPAGVGQLVLTRLLLFTGEWFINITDGTPWMTQILGYNTQATRDRAIKARILDTQGVVSILNYSSTVTNRNLKVTAEIVTLYGVTTITTVL